MIIQSPDVTDSFHDHDHCQSEQVRTVLRVGQGADLDKYILKLTQIHLEIWTNKFSNSGRASATSSTSWARSPTRRTCCEKPDIFNCSAFHNIQNDIIEMKQVKLIKSCIGPAFSQL